MDSQKFILAWIIMAWHSRFESLSRICDVASYPCKLWKSLEKSLLFKRVLKIGNTSRRAGLGAPRVELHCKWDHELFKGRCNPDNPFWCRYSLVCHEFPYLEKRSLFLINMCLDMARFLCIFTSLSLCLSLHHFPTTFFLVGWHSVENRLTDLGSQVLTMKLWHLRQDA